MKKAAVISFDQIGTPYRAPKSAVINSDLLRDPLEAHQEIAQDLHERRELVKEAKRKAELDVDHMRNEEAKHVNEASLCNGCRFAFRHSGVGGFRGDCAELNIYCVAPWLPHPQEKFGVLSCNGYVQGEFVGGVLARIQDPEIIKAYQGPVYTGPRGGKYKDPDHKIPLTKADLEGGGGKQPAQEDDKAGKKGSALDEHGSSLAHKQAEQHLDAMQKALEGIKAGNSQEFYDSWSKLDAHISAHASEFSGEQLKSYAEKLESMNQSIQGDIEGVKAERQPKTLIKKLMEKIRNILADIGLGKKKFDRVSAMEVPDRDAVKRDKNYKKIGQGAMGTVHLNTKENRVVKHGYIPHKEAKIMRIAAMLGVGPQVYGAKSVDEKDISKGSHLNDPGAVEMQYLNGYSPSHQWFGEGGLPQAEHDMHMIAAVKKLHDKGIYHGDLHSGNLMTAARRGADGKPMVADVKVIDYGMSDHSPKKALLEVSDSTGQKHAREMKKMMKDAGLEKEFSALQGKYKAEAEKDKSAEDHQKDIGSFYDEFESLLQTKGLSFMDPGNSKSNYK